MTKLRSQSIRFTAQSGAFRWKSPFILEGNGEMPGAESTFTENVSARGARVVSARRWEQG